MIRWLLIPLVGWVLFGFFSPPLPAQTETDLETGQTMGFEGRWEGRLGASDLLLVLDLTKTVDGLYFGILTSVDQGNAMLSIDCVQVNGDSIRFEVPSAGAAYVAEMNRDKTNLVGTWIQRGRARLEFSRTEKPPEPKPEPNAYSLFGVAADISVPVPPTPVLGNGERHLAYEIHIRNHSGVEMLLTRLDVLDGETALGSWNGGGLHAIVGQRRSNVPDNRLLPPGGWALAYVWVAMDTTVSQPSVLRHRLTVGDRTLEGTVHVVGEDPIVVGPPLRGGIWFAANGPGNDAGHRRALVPIAGQAFVAQRYAIDWAKLGPTGRLYDGDRGANESYFGYGEEVLAVADGTIESVRDGIPENVAGTASLRTSSEGDTLRAAAITLETVSGNHVVLNLGGGRYAFYGHLIPGSIRVKPGDRVRRGDVLGYLGNSGNSTGPHLHFHVSDGKGILGAEGIPYVIDSWESVGQQGEWVHHREELPMQDARVRFPRG